MQLCFKSLLGEFYKTGTCAYFQVLGINLELKKFEELIFLFFKLTPLASCFWKILIQTSPWLFMSLSFPVWTIAIHCFDLPLKLTE